MKDSGQVVVRKVVKRNKYAGQHYGGSWKIAYADFLTAMMAFFLLMWLIGSVSTATLDGIADYFKMPLKIALRGGPESTTDTPSVVKLPSVALKNILSSNTADRRRLRELSKKLQKILARDETLNRYGDQVKIQMVPEGLRVLIIDKDNRPMFDLGGHLMLPHTQELLKTMVEDIRKIPNKIGISGHTDAVPYVGRKSYGNWELSTDRANAARRILVEAGLPEERILRVVGAADSDLLDKDNPLSASNRRIEIVILNEQDDSGVTKIESSSQASTMTNGS